LIPFFTYNCYFHLQLNGFTSLFGEKLMTAPAEETKAIKKNRELAIRILKEFKSVAVVGISNNPERPSYRVAKYLIDHGYEVVGVNPGQSEILGRPCYKDLASIPHRVDVVDIFRAKEFLPTVIDEAIAIQAKALWLQEGLVCPEGEAKAHQHQILTVHDICMKRLHEEQF
jgi:predicted CoA-binding protein